MSIAAFRSSVVERTRPGGKFIYPPRFAKWLAKMRFLAEPAHHAVDAALFIDGKLDPQLNPLTAETKGFQ